MSIIETGNDSLTPEIVLCGLRSGHLPDGLVRSDRGDALTPDRQSFHPKVLFVRGKDLAVVQDYVRRLRPGEASCTEHGENPTQSGFHKNIRSSPTRRAAIIEIPLYFTDTAKPGWLLAPPTISSTSTASPAGAVPETRTCSSTRPETNPR